MSGLLPILCCTYCALGAFLFGYDTGVISSVIEQTDFNERFGHGKLSATAVGGIVSSFTGGAIVGTLLSSLLSDRYGRRAAILAGATLCTIGGALQAAATVVAMMVVGRVIAGLGVGMLSPTIPNFCMEVAPNNIRGMLGGLQQWMIGLGIVVSQWVGYGGSLTHGAFSWRFPLAVQVAPAILLACGVYCWPESPRWLLAKGRNHKARRALERLHLRRDMSNQASIDWELENIQQTLEVEQRALTNNWHQFFRQKFLLKRVLLACGIQLFTQTSGVNVIGYYGPRIYSALGYSPSKALFIQGLYGALAQLWNTVCLLVVDKVQRRKLLIPSLVGMGCCLCVEATLVRYFPPKTDDNVNALRAAVAMNFVYSIFFTSLGVISWIYPGEIFPTAFRARGTSLSTLTNWAANLIFAQCSPLALSTIGVQYFYFFVAFNWLAAVIVFCSFPETQGRTTLESAGHIFGDFAPDGPDRDADIQGRDAQQDKPDTKPTVDKE